ASRASSFSMTPTPPLSALFPTRRSSDLLPPGGRGGGQGHPRHVPRPPVRQGGDVRLLRAGAVTGDPRRAAGARGGDRPGARPALDRKTTRLNSTPCPISDPVCSSTQHTL